MASEWTRVEYQGRSISVAELRMGGWIATVELSHVERALAIPGPGEGVFIGVYESWGAAGDAAKKYIDEKRKQQSKEGTIQVGVKAGGQVYGNVQFPVRSLDVSRNQDFITIRINPAEGFHQEVEMSEIFMSKDIAVWLYLEMGKALRRELVQLAEKVETEDPNVLGTLKTIGKGGYILAILAGEWTVEKVKRILRRGGD